MGEDNEDENLGEVMRKTLNGPHLTGTIYSW